ncbi:hypothetical protein [Frigidibacter oleivorans]|uniref:hypothetical protein n=1 Tax=Frigidibacter oleivorans TaxID=2487129 RepID=UPI000F8F35BB|nr:hypothetical protein [Frigidibacter oleivorans]
MTDIPRLTVFFIVEPPEYQKLACYLAASLREQFGSAVALVGYCPAGKIGEVDTDCRAVLDRLGCDIRPFATEGRFDPAYPHGNKLLATLEPRDTDYSCFMDSDVLCLRPNRVENLIAPGAVALTPAASLNWAPQAMWDRVYSTCGMEKPDQRLMLMRQRKGRPQLPYFSSGLFCFPERHRTAEGQSFPQVWMDLAQKIDADPEVPKKRPYLDQISLPLAIRKAGLDWHLLPEEQHYILGGRMRGEDLPEGREIFTVHYRQWDILRETGLSRAAKDMLERQAGVRRISQMSKRGAGVGA